MEIQRLVPSPAKESSKPSLPPPKETPWKEKPLEDIRMPLRQWPGKKTVEELPEEPPMVPAAIPEATPAPKARRAESVKPSPQKQSLRKKKEPTPVLISEEEEESTRDFGSSGQGETVPSIHQTETKTMVGTRSYDQQKPPPIYKSHVALKRPQKTPGKGGSSQKKPRGSR